MNPFIRLHFDLICKYQHNRGLLPALWHRFIFCPNLITASSLSPPCLLLAKWDYTSVTTHILCRGYLLCLSPRQKQGENTEEAATIHQELQLLNLRQIQNGTAWQTKDKTIFSLYLPTCSWENGQKEGAVRFPLKAHFVCKPCLRVQEKFHALLSITLLRKTTCNLDILLNKHHSL